MGKSMTQANVSVTLTQAGDTVAKNIKPTSHWESTYKNVIEKVGEKDRIVSRRPLWSINRVAYSSGRGYYETEFKDGFGEKSFKLREKNTERLALLDRRAKELYNAKQNISENYNIRVPGYQGHKPMSVVNDRGNPRQECLSMKGESFS
uniref:Uncharacterized protein n=1 Tax=Strombidium rassoulzadegani TaxID=1082188 RepID=A0A7S3CP03_9SPIT|mmetsp:Transcript_1932/g.3345  ORF Transcript_1932/g.3345 Transcript_1932/m.3345 type:complete len:149 (+) Transcript_1932:320-766(+)